MSNTKKVIIWVLSTVAAIAVIIAGFVLITNYINKKPERMAQSFKEKIIGTWAGDYEISKITFNEDNQARLDVLGVGVSGTYTVTYDKETEQYSMNLSYNSSVGISVNRDFRSSLNESETELALTDKESGFNLQFKKNDSNASIDVKSTEANTSSATEKQATADPDFQKKLIGKWINSNNNGGYDFREDGSVGVSLSNLNAEGTYTVTKDDDGKTRLKVSYKTAIGMTISNSYFAQIENNELALSQVGAENIILKYTKA